MQTRSSLVVLAVAATVACAAVACDKVPLSAPTGTTIVVVAGSMSLAAGDSMEIRAIVTEATGSPVQNGTAVRFTTNLGTLDPIEALTNGGVATTMLRAGSVSGVAEVKATSGAITATAININVGAAAAGGVALTASSLTVPAAGGVVTLTAIVTDAAGNRLRSVPVTFATTAGTLSAGLINTDANGEATAQLSTTRTATVTARAGADRTGTVTITVPAPNSIALSVAAPTAVAGSAVALTVTPTIGANNSAPRVSVSWGDGTTDNLGVVGAARTVSHIYASAGSVTITGTATGDGETATATVGVTITARPVLGVTLTATVGAVVAGVGATATLTATVTPATGGADMVESYTWDFGNDAGAVTTAVTTGASVTHVYPSPGAKTATVTVRTTDGRTSVGRVEFIIS